MKMTHSEQPRHCELSLHQVRKVWASGAQEESSSGRLMRLLLLTTTLTTILGCGLNHRGVPHVKFSEMDGLFSFHVHLAHRYSRLEHKPRCPIEARRTPSRYSASDHLDGKVPKDLERKESNVSTSENLSRQTLSKRSSPGLRENLECPGA